jgi:hypothetical protein
MPSRRNKYGAKKTHLDGHTFDSLAEARRYSVLKLRQQAGEITNLELQPAFPLHAPGGQKVGLYKADFRYTDTTTGQVVVEDVKGGKATETQLFRWKRKHLEAEHGIRLQIITK